MSRARRKRNGDTRVDNYATPRWAVERFLEACELPGGAWAEVCAGDGRIIEMVNRRRNDVAWTAFELREECRPVLEALTPDVRIGNFLEAEVPTSLPLPFRVAITNPPYVLAEEVIRKCHEIADITVMHLRVNFLASDGRAEWYHGWMPDTYILPNRPSYRGKGQDATEYAWMVWDWRRVSGYGRCRVLATTPKHVRSAEKAARLLVERAGAADNGAVPVATTENDITRPETPDALAETDHAKQRS